MPRRGNVPKREILPNPIYGSVLVTKLVNSIMLDGKKGVAQKVVKIKKTEKMRTRKKLLKKLLRKQLHNKQREKITKNR